MNRLFVLSMLLLRCQSFLLPTVTRTSRVISRAATAATATATTNSIVVVKRNRQSMEFRKGSPLVFEGAISYTTGREDDPPQLAELVQVVVEQEKNSKGGKNKQYKHVDTKPQNTQPIGWGVYNPHSLYRVRILCHANLCPVLYKTLKSSSDDNDDNAMMATILQARLQAAIQTRQALGLPSTATDSYRLVNGEGDGLSGLAMDVLGGSVVVIMSSAAWCQVYRNDIVRVVSEMMPDDMTVVWKTTPSRLKQDGWEENKEIDDDVNDADDIDQDETTAVVIRENNILYNTYPFQRLGQKTGFYCDQRDNRLALAQLCGGKSVLDLCCYHGGFSLAAKLLGDASDCTGVDSSQEAIDTCHENAQLNGIDGDTVHFVRDDIAKFMKQSFEVDKKEWDVIVLDPPKLAPTVSGLERATRKYHSLNRDAIKLVSAPKGGLLLTCTCSGAMTQQPQKFLQMVQQAAASAGRTVTLLRTSGAAPCHTTSPASFPAGAYLTAALFHVAPQEE